MKNINSFLKQALAPKKTISESVNSFLLNKLSEDVMSLINNQVGGVEKLNKYHNEKIFDIRSKEDSKKIMESRLSVFDKDSLVLECNYKNQSKKFIINNDNYSDIKKLIKNSFKDFFVNEQKVLDLSIQENSDKFMSEFITMRIHSVMRISIKETRKLLPEYGDDETPFKVTMAVIKGVAEYFNSEILHNPKVNTLVCKFIPDTYAIYKNIIVIDGYVECNQKGYDYLCGEEVKKLISKSPIDFEMDC